MDELLGWCRLSQEQEEQMSAGRVELMGNMSLIINTILTSTFGAWMGLSACIGCGLGSIKMLTFISMVAFFVSGMIGYVSLTMTKNQARQSINNQRLHNLQLYVLQLINKKINEKADNAYFYLNTAVFVLQNEKSQLTMEKTNHSFRSVANGYEWYEKLNHVLKIRLGQVSHLVPSETYQKQVAQMAYLISLFNQLHAGSKSQWQLLSPAIWHSPFFIRLKKDGRGRSY